MQLFPFLPDALCEGAFFLIEQQRNLAPDTVPEADWAEAQRLIAKSRATANLFTDIICAFKLWVIKKRVCPFMNDDED